MEEHTQVSFDEDSVQEQTELVRRLNEVLEAREEEGVSMHLASREKEEEIMVLKQAVQARDDKLVELKARVSSMESFIELNMNDFDYLCNENRILKEKALAS